MGCTRYHLNEYEVRPDISVSHTTCIPIQAIGDILSVSLVLRNFCQMVYIIPAASRHQCFQDMPHRSRFVSHAGGVDVERYLKSKKEARQIEQKECIII